MKAGCGFLFCIVSVLVSLSGEVFAQKQLVFLHHETVLKRYYPGDDFVFKLKGSSSVTETYVNNLFDTAIVTHADMVPFRRIERVYFVQHKFYNTIGTVLLLAGVGYFLIDQLNKVAVHGDRPSFTAGESRFSLTTIGIGLPLILFKKRSQRVDYAHQFLMVKTGSPFYRPDPKGYTSPYLPY